MGTLIDATKLFEKVSEILDIPVQQLTHHHSLLEVIDLLVKEIDAMEDYVELLA
jgi:predicted transcriptional regulator